MLSKNITKISTDAEFALHLLEKHNLDLNTLSEEELSVVRGALNELQKEGSSRILSQLIDIDFWHKPPTIEQFVEDDYYLGSVCRANQVSGATGLYPKWRELLLRDFSPGVDVNQVCITGGIGTGKSTLATVMMLYRLCHILCLKAPSTYYRLMRNTPIVFNFFSITQQQIRYGAFAMATTFMRSSPFFAALMKDDSEARKYANRKIEFPNSVMVEAGSRTTDALGRNSLCCLVDEINFRIEKEAALAAQELIQSITARINSRFKTGINTNPGLIVIISSAKSTDDFLENHINSIKHDPAARIYSYPVWEVKGNTKINYSGEKFWVDIGDNAMHPRILPGNPSSKDLATGRCFEVPIEHKSEFESNLIGSIRDVLGKPTSRQSKFITNLTPLFNCVRDDIPKIMNTEVVGCSTDLSPDENDIAAALDLDSMLSVRGNIYLPKRHPFSPRFLHIDMSPGAHDAMGICMIHPTGIKEVTEWDMISGFKRELTRPVYEIDFAFRITRSNPLHMIDYGKVRQFIVWLRDECNFNIKMVSADLIHASQETLDILSRLHFETKYVSVDKKKDAYAQLRQTIFEGRLKTAKWDWLIQELINLEDTGDKIDHPTRWTVKIPSFDPGTDVASKDVADGLAGALVGATQYEEIYVNDEMKPPVQTLIEQTSRQISTDGPKDKILIF